MNWLHSDIAVLTSYAFGAIGLTLTVIFYFKQKRKKIPCMDFLSINLVSPKIQTIDNLNILFDNEHINCMTISKFIFWNAGNETINKADIATGQFKIVSNNDIRILSASLERQSNESNDVSVIFKSDVNTAFVSFDYLDNNEGFILKVIHTGKDSNDLQINSKIKGVGGFKIQDQQKIEDFPALLPVILLSIILFVVIIISTSAAAKIGCAIVLLVIFYMIFDLRKTKRIPKGINKYFTNN